MKPKNKKGITLVELCVAMGVVSVIAAVVVSLAVWVAKQNEKVTSANDFIKEMAAFQTSVENLLSKYDSSDYDFSVDEQKITVKRSKDSGIVESLTYIDADKVLKNRAGAVICSLQSSRTLKFEPLQDGGNTVLIKCEIVFENKNENKDEMQTFYFSIHNSIVRERYVSPDRPKSEESS